MFHMLRKLMLVAVPAAMLAFTPLSADAAHRGYWRGGGYNRQYYGGGYGYRSYPRYYGGYSYRPYRYYTPNYYGGYGAYPYNYGYPYGGYYTYRPYGGVYTPWFGVYF